MPSVFIAGCGFVGLATARRLHALGWHVTGGTHSPESAAALASEPFPVLACDITDRDSLAKIPAVDAVIHCASSGRGGVDQYRAVYLDGIRALAEVLAPRQLLFTSSTSVYAQTDGSFISEKSPAEPDRETGRILREAEDFTLTRGGIVARLAGIYGPGRSVILRKFLAGETIIEGDGSRFINQAHRDDIAAALVHLLTGEATGIFNVCDDAWFTQLRLHEWLAAHFEKPLPPFGPIDPHRKRGWTSKRVSNSKLRCTGWTPIYPSFIDAVKNDPDLIPS